jgi:D-alanyl-D-alanine carboxypeptidase
MIFVGDTLHSIMAAKSRFAGALSVARLGLILAIAAMSLDAACTMRPTDPMLAPLLQQGVDRGYPGFAIAYQSSDGITRSGSAGFSNLEENRKLRFDEPFHIGSITKTFTAVATLQLVDQGKLSLDATLGSLLGDTVKNIPYANQITIAQLLDHSSGIYATNNDLDYLSTLLGPTADPKRVFTPLELVALADQKRHEPSGRPGEKHSYSDSNYTLLGLIVEKQSGRPFKRYISEEILAPLRLRSTYFYSDAVVGPVGAKREMMQGYLIATQDIRQIITINPLFRAVKGARRPEGELLNTTLASERNDAAGGIVSTLPDLMRFGSALFRGRLLSRPSQAFLTSAGTAPAQPDIGQQRTWALQATHKPYGMVLYKQGDGPGGTTELLAYLPDRDLVFAGFTNSFGYFDEVDFMLDKILPILETKGQKAVLPANER